MKASSLRALAVAAIVVAMALAGVARIARGAQDPAAAAAAGTPAGAAATGPHATVLEINGAIGPATSRYVIRGLEAARQSGSQVVVLEMDTPGGLDVAMRDIIRAILASPIPVVSYVAPSGARAASAGTYILYASHVAAMAPATNLGAATPVSIGGEPEPAPNPEPAKPERDTGSPSQSPSAGHDTPPPAGAPPGRSSKSHRDAAPGTSPESSHPDAPGSPPGSTHPDADPGSRPESTPPREDFPVPTSAMERKVVNDAVAYIRGLAELRGRNAEWAERAVRGAASLSATAALEQKVIDVIARDLPDLLAQIDGREVRVGNREVKLATRDLAVVQVKPDWRTQLLAVITNPTVAYGLMLIGIYGLLLEGYNPGAVLPGVVGTISLLLALFAFQILSVNYAGLALVALGIGLIIAEFFYPAFGSLGIGGLIAFIVGSLILFDSDVPGMNIGLPLIGGVATVGGLLIIVIVYLATHSMRRPVVTGVQGMLGEQAEVVEDFTGKGRVRYGGEIWNARSSSTLRAGQSARIVKVEGLTLWVEP